MRFIVRDSGKTRSFDIEGDCSVIDALRECGFAVDAPCGGMGTCKKCRMLIADDEGVSYRLACQTWISDGLEVTIERNRKMSVSMGGAFGRWQADDSTDAFGLAIDVGTTTLVMRLHDLDTGKILGACGRSNPQLAYGADVISRISASAGDGLASMAALLGDTLVEMALILLDDAHVDKAQVRSVVLAGNTTMQLIAAGLDPTPIGAAPFVPPTRFGERRVFEPFARAGIAAGEVLFAPCVAAYVGGDITAGLLACDMHGSSELALFMDLGTNGEMALGNADGIVTCATAAGPVFEGANIKYGMPAYPGAISQVALGDDGSLELGVIGDEDAVGICGTGLFDACALLLDCGIIDETGRMVDADELDASISRGLERHLCEEDGQPAFALTKRIRITQKDVRNLQLAKASVCAGVLTLLKGAGASLGDIGSLLIAGGFGEYLDLDAAARIGIFPSELRAVARSVGNAAIEGASAMLVSRAAREELESILGTCDYIELSTSADFNELYIEQMMFE